MSIRHDIKKQYSIIGDGKIGITPCSIMSYGYLCSGKIKSDLLFLVSCYKSESYNKQSKAIFARNSIILMAFYFESLSNSLFNESDSTWNSSTKKLHGHLSKPVRKFIAKYQLEFGNKIPIDYKGIQDLFTVRNKIFAHAPEQTVLSSNAPKEVTKLAYQKFTNFPSSFAEFSETEADLLFKELNMFIYEYTSLMKSILPDWWLRLCKQKPNKEK